MAQFNHRCNSVMEEISEDAVSLMREYLELSSYILYRNGLFELPA